MLKHATTWWLLVPALAGQTLEQAEKSAKPLARYEFNETHMASTFKIVLYSSDAAFARRASRAAYDRIAQLNAILSDYDPESELSRLPGTAFGRSVKVSGDLFEVMDRSRIIYERSGGAFDVTIAPIGRLWRRARRDRKLPDPRLIAAARPLVGFDKVILDPKARTVELKKAGMKLDVGGIAKGFAAQAAIDVLKGLGITRALVAGAGDIVVGERPPDADGWAIAVAPVDPDRKEPPLILSLENQGVSTSGDAERFVIIDGRRYSHIINPATGLGVEDRASVTVVAPNGGTADALETTVYILGPERGLKLVDETPGAAAIFVRLTANGVTTFESARFKDVPRQNKSRAGHISIEKLN
jgi:thiamine biosynthesis lipoprotein